MATNTRLIRYYICYKVARYFFTFFCVCFRIKMVHVLLLKQCLKRQDRFTLEPDIETLWVFVFCNKGRESARIFFEYVHWTIENRNWMLLYLIV